MGLTTRRVAAVIALAALLTGSAASAAWAESAVRSSVPVPAGAPGDVYIVVLAEPAVAAYEGGRQGMAGTSPRPGEAFDPHSRAAMAYASFLEARQQEVAADLGVTPLATYRMTLDGFSARMSPDQVAAASAHPDVLSVSPDEVRHPSGTASDEFIGREVGPAGGTPSHAGSGVGVVVGVIGTGIAPGNPSFAGEPLRPRIGAGSSDAGPGLVGDSVVWDKADGTRFRSARTVADGWSRSDYSTKLVGGAYFAAGAQASGFDFLHDSLSPRDVSGRGTHAAGVAAGGAGVTAIVGGVAIGTVSGVAPAARIAIYKACYAGLDPSSTADDVCMLSDVLSAVDAAVGDGVDVISNTVERGDSASAPDLEDSALRGAAEAGVFVAVGAGDAGADGPGSARPSAPWYTTVAASTVPASEGTVRMAHGWAAVGATVTLQPGHDITARVVLASDIPAEGAGTVGAGLCYPGSLDPVRAKGAIVVCDRGTNPREEKSRVVADAGGVGMILVNVLIGGVGGDAHAVPTIHLDVRYRAALLAHVHETPDAVATLVGENTTGLTAAWPQIAGFSGRGPAAGGLPGPDVAAPGAGVLAAMAATDAGPSFGFLSGTEVAAAHVAGAAAAYLSARPFAAPAEIRSALTTTASDTVEADGSPSTDPFAQGAGLIDPARALDPGLVYLSGPADWGAAEPGPDLNLASISIDRLGGTETVTRTVTSTRAGSYTVAAEVAGIEVTVAPAALTFDAANELKTFSVTFRRTIAPPDRWATGLLAWTGADGAVVRSPLAVRPTVQAPASVRGAGISGSAGVAIEPAGDRDLPLTITGLAPVELVADPAHPVEGHTGDESSGDGNRTVSFPLEIPAGTSLARVALAARGDDSDLALTVYRLVGGGDGRYVQRWQSDEPADDEVTLVDPVAGSYEIAVALRATSGPMTWDLSTAIVGPGGAGSLAASPNPLPTPGARYTLSWTGLEPATRYLGVVAYGDADVRTVITIDSGSRPPVADSSPEVTGLPELGETLTASPGAWTPSGVTFDYRWLRDGAAIEGASSADYIVAPDDVGTTLSVLVTATVAGSDNTGAAVSGGVIVTRPSTVVLTMNRPVGTAADSYAVTVEVATDGPPATGTVTVTVDGAELTGTLASGAVVFPLRAQPRGIHVVVGAYAGSATVAASTGISGFIVTPGADGG
jgi:hypothetical protein